MITQRLLVFPRQLLNATRLLLCAAIVVISSASQTSAQSARAHLSDDLKHRLESGDAVDTSVILSGSIEEVDAIATRHGLRVTRRLAAARWLMCQPAVLRISPTIPRFRSCRATTSSVDRWRLRTSRLVRIRLGRVRSGAAGRASRGKESESQSSTLG